MSIEIDLTEAVEVHHPVKGGSSVSNIPGGYTGDWVICSCDPEDLWNQMAQRIPIADYPAHLLADAAPLIEAQVRAQVAAEIEASIGTEPVLMHVVDWTDGVEHAARIARGTS